MKVAILGAGLTGLELGKQLKQQKKDFIILEKESRIGGLCRTNKTKNYYWDFGVHAMYSRHKDIMNYFYSLPLDYEYLNRNVKIVHFKSNGDKILVDYPFEIGIKDLPLNDKLECVQGYLAARFKKRKSCSNLKEWIDSCAGKGIAKHFMVPYNNKIWNCRLEEISEKLVGSKIEPAPIIDFMLSVLGKKTTGRAYQAKFLYPKKGISKLVEHTAKDISDKIVLNFEIKKLIRDRDGWRIISDNGTEAIADIIVSTIPLVELIKYIEIAGVEKEYDIFKWNDTFFVMIGLKKGHDCQVAKDCQWVFFKDNEVFYRLTLMSNFSPELSPAIVAEITRKDYVCNKTEKEIEDLVIKDLIRLRIIGSVDLIAETDIRLLKHTYPIPTVGLEETKELIRKKLEAHSIFLLGRNGNWDYINMDGVILKVQEFLTDKFLQLI